MQHGKLVTAAEAVRRIRDHDTVATGGFVGIGFAENIAVALEQRFLGSDPQSPAGGLDIDFLGLAWADAYGNLNVSRFGKHLAGAGGVKHGQQVLYVTERCVFRLVGSGLELIEIAPGIDLERDILGQMAFRPLISPTLKTMNPEIFRDKPMGMRNAMLVLPH
jgi:acyl CoA:acetate/3-ketoacid CoA transferase